LIASAWNEFASNIVCGVSLRAALEGSINVEVSRRQR